MAEQQNLSVERQQLTVQADHSQSAEIFPISSRGKQCVTNSFMFLLFCHFYENASFTKHDLHSVLETGDVLYHLIIKSNSFLLASELPNHIEFRNKYISSFVRQTYFGNMAQTVGEEVGFSLENSLNMSFAKYDACILIFHSAAIALKQRGDRFFVFDAHNRGNDGLCDPDGKCTMTIHNCFQALCNFLRHLCMSLSCISLDNVQYEINAFCFKTLSNKPRKPVTRICSESDLSLGENRTQSRKRCWSEHNENRNPKCQDHSLRKKGKTEKMDNDVWNKRGTQNVVIENYVDSLNLPEVEEISSNSDCQIENDVSSCSNVTPLREGLEQTEEIAVMNFKQLVKEGPLFVCSCCTQTWFRDGVSKAQFLYTLDIAHKCLQGIKSAKDTEWICHTCKKYLKLGKIPALAVVNGLEFPPKPPELNITEMEERLISPRIPFMQLMEKPRGGQKSLRGNVVNVPSDVNTTVKSLPRTLAETETIQVKLKRKLSYKHHVLYEAIRPNKCMNALKWLLENSELFRNEGISIRENWDILQEQREFYATEQKSGENATSCENTSYTNELENETSSLQDEDDVDEWTEDPNFESRLTGNTDTLLHPADVRSLNKTMSFAPGENQTPLGLYQDPDAEYLAFPTIYCGQRRMSNKNRTVPVTYSSICKWELRSQDRRAACSMPNLFFKLKKLQIKQIQDKVTLAMRKCKSEGKKITAGHVLNPTSFDNIVKLNEGYRVLRTLRGSPAYWESAKRDVFAMIRQLGIPTWFCSFSAAETKWKNLIQILSKSLNNAELTESDVDELTWIEKCELIKRDPVTCSRYFSHRFQIFMSKILKGDCSPLGKIVDHFFRVEFQQRGSPHIHLLLWIENAPVYGKSTNEEIQNFIDEHSTCFKNENIAELVNYQTHRHARTCKKAGKNICRFNFPLPPMPETIILEPLEEDKFEQNADVQQNYRKICELLNDSKLCNAISFDEFLTMINLTKEDYILAIRSSLKSPKVFLRRSIAEIRINPYNQILLRSWEANIDVQFILDAYACAAYIVSYISKSQRGMSNLLHDACEEARKGNLSLKQQIRQIGNKFLTHVEICAQEAAYLLLQMPLRSSSRNVVFINTCDPENRTFLLKSLEVLQDMPENSTNIESDNWIKRYKRRPGVLQNYCLADFVSKFDVVPPPKDKKQNNIEELLPEDEYEEMNEDNSDVSISDEDNSNSQKEYHMKDGSILKLRKTQKVIRYVRYNKEQDSENYFREQLMLFYPWRNEENDLIGNHTSFESHFNQQQEKIKKNKLPYEADRGIVDVVENNMNDLLSNVDHIVAAEVQHNEEIDFQEDENLCLDHGCFNPKFAQMEYDLGFDLGIARKQVETDDISVNMLSDKEYKLLARSLNQNQKIFFYHILHKIKTNDLPIHCFLTGGAGVGKSLLTTCLFQAIVRYYAKRVAEKCDEVKAVLCAPTGKAAYNIGGQTIHSLFCIPANQNLKYKPLDVQQLDNMRVKFRSLKIVFIDEVSMVGNKMFNYINLRLQEIFAKGVPFGGISIIAIGDLFQLKPVFDGWIFENLTEGYGPLATNLWTDLFRVFELTEIMRQKEDKNFAELLNRLREGKHNDNDINVLRTRICTEEIQNLNSIPHLFTTNVKVNFHNSQAYEKADSNDKCIVTALDAVTGDVSSEIKNAILLQVSDDPSKTMGLCKKLQLVTDLPAEVCININVQDGLTNGSPCIVKKLDYRVIGSNRCSIVWVLFDDPVIGFSARQKYCNLYSEDISKDWTPILEVTKKFTVGRHKSCHVTRRQFPLRLACAKTIHKAQGSTLNNVVLDLGKRKLDHIHYVGLSRVRKLQDLHILSLNEEKIGVSGNVVCEMERMRNHAALWTCLPILENITSDLKIIYHNSRSLHLHISDLLSEKNILSGDIVAVTESRLKASDNSENYLLPGFHIYRFDEEESSHTMRPFYGSVIYSKYPLINVSKAVLNGIQTVKATLMKNSDLVQIIFIYCPPKFATITNICCFLVSVLNLLDTSQPFLIMGDTNIDYFTQRDLSSNLKHLNIRQIMHSSTTDYGSCLDHVYTNLNSSAEISCATLESYYSDHKPIVVYLPF